jgi:hypothetical protein
MPRLVALCLLAALAGAQEKPDLGKILRGSKEFAEKCKRMRIAFEPGVVRAEGTIHYRGGGPCEYLITVHPAKAHETIVLLDNGPWEGEERRPREALRGLAEVLNNAFLAAGFKKGKAFDWDRKTGEAFLPKGETVYVYAEWTDKAGKAHRARMSDWLWNFKTIEVMEEGKFVYTGSVLLEEELPGGGRKFWLGAEVDGLVAAVLNTSSSIVDNLEEGGLDNGAYEAIPIRIPDEGTRVKIAFSKKKLEVSENYPPLKLPKELIEEKKRRAAEAAKKKLDEPKDKPKVDPETGPNRAPKREEK